MNSSFRLLIAAMVLLVAGCNLQDEPCQQPGTVSVRLGAYRRADTGTAVIDTYLVQPLLIVPDAVLGPTAFQFGKKVNKLSLSLNPNADSARWIIQPDSAVAAVRDTLVFRYTRRTQFLSNTCGYIFFYSVTSLSHTSHALDSVRVSKPDVTNDANTEHVRLYF